MAQHSVICPRCSEWRQEEVSDKEIEQRLCAGALPIESYCDDCKHEMNVEFDMRHPHLGCCGEG